MALSNHQRFLLGEACIRLDKLQVELHPETPYETPGPEETRSRLLEAMDFLEQLEKSED